MPAEPFKTVASNATVYRLSGFCWFSSIRMRKRLEGIEESPEGIQKALAGIEKRCVGTQKRREGIEECL